MDKGTQPADTLVEPRKVLDDKYLASRTSGQILEYRLQGYFTEVGPCPNWHRVMDLLTVRYFQSIGEDTPGLYERNALGYEGAQHSGLSVEDMRNRAVLLNAYQEALSVAVHSVFSASLTSRSDRSEPRELVPPQTRTATSSGQKVQ